MKSGPKKKTKKKKRLKIKKFAGGFILLSVLAPTNLTHL